MRFRASGAKLLIVRSVSHFQYPNMKYAVISIKGNQYKVAEGDEILVDKVIQDNLNPDVLLLVEGEKVKIGKPKLTDVKVKVKIVKDVEKGDKLYVQKFKAKSRYRRKMGFRPLFTRLLIEKIS